MRKAAELDEAQKAELYNAQTPKWWAGVCCGSCCCLTLPLLIVFVSLDYATLTYQWDEVLRGIYGYGGLLCRNSDDGCRTAKGTFGSDTDCFMLGYHELVGMMEQVPDRMDKLEVSRGNELGHFRVNTYIYPEFELGWSQERHNPVRPYMNAVWGPQSTYWSQQSVRDSVQAYMAGVGDSFVVEADISRWVAKYLHEVTFGLTLTEENLTDFVAFQSQSLMMIILPDFLNPLIKLANVAQGYVDNRKKWMAFYKASIPWETHPLFKTVPEERRDDAVAVLSAGPIFAGGLGVPHGISSTLALMYSDHESRPAAAPRAKDVAQFSDAKLEAFVWEAIRLYTPVSEFPWIENELETRYLMVQMLTLRDPDIWGPDQDDFRIRDLEMYWNYSGIGFVEPANGVEKDGHRWVQKNNSRGCPGQDLAIALMVEFVREWTREAQTEEWVSPDAGNIFFTGPDLFTPPVMNRFTLERKT